MTSLDQQEMLAQLVQEAFSHQQKHEHDKAIPILKKNDRNRTK